jgi:uncharacterized membrane protein
MWFVFALLSAVFAGLHTFMVKVAAEKKYDTYLLGAFSSFVTAVLALILFIATSPDRFVPGSLYLFGIATGVLFASFTIARMEALKLIDAALFFPLYKVIGPAVVAVIGIFILKESITPAELIGIGLSCAVPLLLISREENHRQKNLRLGLILMAVGTVLASFSAAVNAVAVQGNASLALPLVALANAFAAVVHFGLFLSKHRKAGIRSQMRAFSTKTFLSMSFANGVVQLLSFYFLLLALVDSNLSIVYSINAHYILIPVLLSVWLYKEHWNKQKAAALVLSMLALVLLHR